MDFNSQQQAETELLDAKLKQRRNNDSKIKPENLTTQRKDRKSLALFYIRVGLSEVIGTAMLLFLGCAGTIPGLIEAPNIMQISVVFGLAIYVIIQIFLHISGGHLNPSVTTAALIFKVVTIPAGAVYITAQFLGAILGYGLLLVLVPREALYSSGQPMNVTHGLCVSLPNPKVALWQAFFGEFIATSILIFVCCAIWDKKNESQIQFAPLKLGLTVLLIVAALGQISSCSLNPARTLAPAIFTGIWTHQWLYWLGPISAAIGTSYFYIFIFKSFEKPSPPDAT